MVRRTKIAFCGTRGIPANYGGFETTIQEISRRFAAKGLDCEVFCRASNNPTPINKFNECQLVYVRGARNRKFDTFLSSIETGIHLLRNRNKYSYVFWFNNANLPGIILTLVSGLPMAVNTNGLEWKRQKWSILFKIYYLIASFLISRCCKNLISDSLVIQSYYKKYFFKKTIYVPYGVPSFCWPDADKSELVLEKYGLVRNKYFLQITRIEPDNWPLEVLLGFRSSGLCERGFRMVLIGYKESTPYSEKIKALAGKEGITVLDALYDLQILTVLRENCFGYVHGNSVGGTNPALLEAMACCPRIMAIDVPFSREVLGDLGIFFKPPEISAAFSAVLNANDNTFALRARISRFYRWDEVADSYERFVKGQSAEYRPRVGEKNLF